LTISFHPIRMTYAPFKPARHGSAPLLCRNDAEPDKCLLEIVRKEAKRRGKVLT
jgi:hypothetical protein